MLRTDEDGRMLCFSFRTNICYIFSNANGIDNGHLLTNLSNFVQFNKKSTCCNVRLSIIMKR